MVKRVLVKWLHWLAFALMLWFFFMEPDVSDRADITTRADQLSTHAGMGMLLAVVTIIWSILYFRNGPLGRPGPKLPGWGKLMHRVVNTGLYWLLPITVLTGATAEVWHPSIRFGASASSP